MGVAPIKEGLIGLWGHTFKDGEIEWQFRVVRRIGFNQYLVQLFSWLDGAPTNLATLAEKDLLGIRCKLYLSNKIMRAASDKAAAGKAARDDRGR